ncbi:hypothetical protein BJ684DRAFT_14584 [Piptocephalis cylindrospora]|uniref:Uncharacterized protein n=1 Tax=Piptocephalis cylindrospora TaxID=1907219 RepID=A0A4P9Y7V0_9FUNG|nr:hypothetical protein BJ684DRAFT_14584 [Piptocephalis cylindrospora]|eukprot:RKP15143.1 hypothetical protein BJ684DRAFT_14584 [Piptocephalis cylindrospora]
MEQSFVEPSPSVLANALVPSSSSPSPPVPYFPTSTTTPASTAVSMAETMADSTPTNDASAYSPQQLGLVIGASVGVAGVALIAFTAFLIIRNRRLKTKADEWVISTS